MFNSNSLPGLFIALPERALLSFYLLSLFSTFFGDLIPEFKHPLQA